MSKSKLLSKHLVNIYYVLSIAFLFGTAVNTGIKLSIVLFKILNWNAVLLSQDLAQCAFALGLFILSIANLYLFDNICDKLP
jgi:hypothetical protein